MKLLLDENLSRRIIPSIQVAYPESSQVALLGLNSASDREIWKYAKTEHFAIVTQDADFQELSLLTEGPPLVIWLRCGNHSRSELTQKLLDYQKQIEEANLDDNIWCLEIY
jgi:predicted nuclease of predicted toxin-antitoxin system